MFISKEMLLVILVYRIQTGHYSVEKNKTLRYYQIGPWQITPWQLTVLISFRDLAMVLISDCHLKSTVYRNIYPPPHPDFIMDIRL